MDSQILQPRIDDTLEICERTSRPKFLKFLSAEETAFAEKYLSKRNVSFLLFGGYEGAERKMLGCFPEWAEADDSYFPICAVTFAFRKGDILRHRDFLGSLMALGLTRESIGDILIEEGRAVAFVSNEISEYIINQIEKIGRVGVTVSEGFSYPLPESDSLADFSDTVASTRLDCVVAALIGASRGNACEKIEGGLVTVNSQIKQKSTLQISDGDVIAVRGKGKFKIESVSEKTRKDRVILKYKKYT